MPAPGKLTLRMSLRALSLAAMLFAATPQALPQEAPVEGGAPIEYVSELAELLGRAHAIRSLCNGDSDQTWRNYMFNMLAIEAPDSGPRKSQLTSAFNRGFRSQSNSSRDCSSDMPAVEAQIATRGRELAEMIAASYLR
jgi:uncharacterized protein (TIGR02301 family)